MRLIDAEILEIEMIKAKSLGELSAKGAIRKVQHAPTVDAVEVVRCKDCKHKPTGSGVNHDITFPEQDYRCPCECEDYWYSLMPDDDWFCANGERREDADSN